MKILAKNWLVILLTLLVVAVGVAIYARMNRQRKEDEIRQIHAMLDSGTGINGVDIKTLIQGTTTENGFDALPYAKNIMDAYGGKWMNDDEEAIYNVFRGKTLAQIASIYNAFSGHYGEDLDAFFTRILNESERSIVHNIIKQAV